MKKINLIIGALVCLFAFSACTDEVGYTPTGATDGVNGAYFPAGEPTSITLTEDGSAFDISICRTDTLGDLVLNLDVQMDSAAAEVLTVPDTVVFKSGENTSIITVTYDATKLVRGESYNFVISIPQNDAMNYQNTAISFTAKFPPLANWISIGKGVYADSFLFYEGYEVEIERDSVNPDNYRIKRPYLPGFLNTEVEGYTSEDYDVDAMDEYLEFSVLRAGQKIYGAVDITKDGLVIWDIYNTGFVHPTYADYINIISPASFTSFANESQIAKSYVKVWQESDKWKENGFLSKEYLENRANTLPAQIQLAPYYYMMSVGGWNYSTADDMITITFPGGVLGDYSVGVEYLGRFTDKENNEYAEIGVTMGDDVASVLLGMAMTGNTEASDAASAVLNGILDGSIEPVVLTEAGSARFALVESGKYTAVAISVDENGKAQEAQYTQFQYVSADAPNVPEVDPNEGWNILGMAKYTDDFIASLFTDAEPCTYDVEVQESDAIPGLYRLVNPYGAAFPYNEEGDWDTSNNYYLEINAVDPQGVYIETQQLGFDWGYGMFVASSVPAQLLDEYDLEVIKSAGYCGTLADGVITFPTKTLLITATALDGFYYANSNSAFRVELPSATKSSKSVKSIVNKRSINKNNISSKKLRLMDRKLVEQAVNNIR